MLQKKAGWFSQHPALEGSLGCGSKSAESWLWCATLPFASVSRTGGTAEHYHCLFIVGIPSQGAKCTSRAMRIGSRVSTCEDEDRVPHI